MKLQPICLSLLVLMATLLGARGEGFRTDINPALLYYGAFLVAPEPMSDADRDYLESKKGLEQKLPERFGKVVTGSDNQFRLVRQAAHATLPCDWGIDLSSGPTRCFPIWAAPGPSAERRSCARRGLYNMAGKRTRAMTYRRRSCSAGMLAVTVF